MPDDPLMRWEWEGGAVLLDGPVDEHAAEHVEKDGDDTAAMHLRWGHEGGAPATRRMEEWRG